MKKELQKKILEYADTQIEQEIEMLCNVEKMLLDTENNVLLLYNVANILNPIKEEKRKLQNIQFMLINF